MITASPGTIWSAIPFIEYLIPVSLLIALISGAKIKIPSILEIELNGILDKETKLKLIELFVDMYKTNKVEQLNQSLNPTQPSNMNELERSPSRINHLQAKD